MQCARCGNLFVEVYLSFSSCFAWIVHACGSYSCKRSGRNWLTLWIFGFGWEFNLLRFFIFVVVGGYCRGYPFKLHGRHRLVDTWYVVLVILIVFPVEIFSVLCIFWIWLMAYYFCVMRKLFHGCILSILPWLLLIVFIFLSLPTLACPKIAKVPHVLVIHGEGDGTLDYMKVWVSSIYA